VGDDHTCVGRTYQPETITLPKDTIIAAIAALESGLDYARSALIEHDSANGRTTRKNQKWAEQMEADIREMECALTLLRPHKITLANPLPQV
jgi:hypothetical protein